MKVLAITARSDRPEAALFTGLASMGVRLQLMCDPANPFRKAFVSAGIPATDLVVANMIDWSAIRNIRAKLADQTFDIIHAFTSRALSNVLLAARGCRSSLVAYRGTAGGLGFLDPVTHLIYRNDRVSKITCNCESVRRFLRVRGLPSSQLVTIYKGHDPSWYEAADRGKLTHFGISKNDFVVGFAGSIRPVKGISVLLESVRRLGDHSNIRILLVGPVRDRTVERMARDPQIAEHCVLAGTQEHAFRLTGACDAFVMPSVGGEGLPKAVIEAMLMGVPPIVSDAGGLPELVQNRKTGLVVPKCNSIALAEAICFLVDHRTIAKNLGENAREWARRHLSVAQTVSETFHLYEMLFQRHDSENILASSGTPA